MTEDKSRHPAYGFIRMSRVSGGSGRLFMSSLRHENRISITIGEAEHVRSLSTDEHYAGRQIIEVQMSEAQFAQFITNSMSHAGAPCTITRNNGKTIPPLEDVQLTSDRYYKEAQKMAEDAIQAVADARQKIGEIAAALPKKKQEEIMGRLNALEMTLSDRMPWIVQMHHEHMDKVANLAKIEIEAYLSRAQTQLTEAEQLPALTDGGLA